MLSAELSSLWFSIDNCTSDFTNYSAVKLKIQGSIRIAHVFAWLFQQHKNLPEIIHHHFQMIWTTSMSKLFCRSMARLCRRAAKTTATAEFNGKYVQQLNRLIKCEISEVVQKNFPSSIQVAGWKIHSQKNFMAVQKHSKTKSWKLVESIVYHSAQCEWKSEMNNKISCSVLCLYHWLSVYCFLPFRIGSSSPRVSAEGRLISFTITFTYQSKRDEC